MKFFPTLIPSKPIAAKAIPADDNLGRGMDLALVSLVFLGLGYLLDRWLGTRPVFMIGLVVLALVGQFVKMWYSYDATMRSHEQARADASHVHHHDRTAEGPS